MLTNGNAENQFFRAAGQISVRDKAAKPLIL